MHKADPVTEKTEIKITPQMQTSFDEVKKAFLRAPILAFPQFYSKEPYKLDTDWSRDFGTISGILSQKQDGVERPICFGAKKLNAAQRNYGNP